jgi:large subunit ribosomal protein L35
MRPISRQLRPQCPSIVRPFTSAAIRRTPAAETQTTPTEADLDPNTVLPEFEEQLMKAGKMPIGSRRRRLAIRSTGDLPFEHLPYQAFQEARKILSEDREEKLGKIQREIEKISRLEATKPEDIKGGQNIKDMRLRGLRKYVEELKILADANDPVVKKRFEDGTGTSRQIARSELQLTHPRRYEQAYLPSLRRSQVALIRPATHQPTYQAVQHCP